MAAQDETRNVNFELSVDSTKVEKGIDKAISALDKYDSALQKSAQKGKVSLTGDEFRNITNDINKTLSSFKSLSAALNSLPQEYKKAFTPDTSGLTKVTQSINEVSRVTKSGAQIVKSDIESFTTPLRSAEIIVESLTQSLKKFSETAKNISISTSTTSTETTWDKQEKSANKLYEAIAKLEKEMRDLGNVSVEELKRINDEVEAAFKEFDNSTQEIERAQAAMKKWQESFQGKGESDVIGGVTALSSDPRVTATLTALKAVWGAFGKIVSAVKFAKNAIDNFKSSLSKLTPTANQAQGVLSTLVGMLGAAGLAISFEQAANAAMDYIENLNLFTVAMGDSIDVAQEFIDKMSEMYGLNPSNLMQYAGNFYQLTDAIDMASEASSIISLSLTKAAMDMSSLFNVDIATVVDNLSSGMQGMSRAVRKYGIDIRQATLAQTGLNYGFSENISTTSEANRQALRFLTIMRQIRNATQQQVKAFDEYTEEDFKELSDNFGLSMEEIRSAFEEAMAGNKEAIYKLGVAGRAVMGDFARNIETPANQLRIIKEQISQLATAIGNLFIPMADALLYRINGLIMALRILITIITSLLGIDTSGLGGEISGFTEGVEDGLDGIGDAADSAKSKLDKLVAPFDELNILAEDAGSAASSAMGSGDYGLDPALLEAIKQMNLELDEIRMKAHDVRDAILEWFGIEWDEELGEFKVVADGLIDNIRNAIESSDYRRVGELIAAKLNESIAWGIEQTDPATVDPKLQKFFANLADIVNGFISTLNFEGIGTIVGQLITNGLMGIDAFLEKFDSSTLGQQVANFFSGLIDAIDWKFLGKTVADAFNVKSGFEEALAKNFPWTKLGNAFGDGITEFFEKTDWEQMGHAAGAKTNGVVKLIRGFFGTYKKGLISESLAEKFNAEIKELDFVKIAQTASNGIRTFFSEIFNFGKHVNKAELAKSIFEFMANIDWIGIIADLVEFIRSALLTLIGALVSAVAGLVVSLVKGVFNTVADVVLGIFGFIYDGIAAFMSDVAGVEMDPNPFREMAEDIRTTFWGTLGDIEVTQAEADDWTGNAKSKVQEGLDAGGGFELIGVTSANSFYEGLKHESNLPEVFGNQVMKGIEDVLLAKNQINELGKTVNTAFGTGLNDTEGMDTYITTFTTNIETKVRGNFQGKFEDIGRSLTDGLLRGMNENIDKISSFSTGVETRVRSTLGVHSPSTVFESIGKYLTEGLLKGMRSNNALIESAYSSMITDMTSKTTAFVNAVILNYGMLTQQILTYLGLQKNQTYSVTNQMSAMYQSMATQSISATQSIISALNAIPRNITTVHTIITQSVTATTGGVTSSSSTAKTSSATSSAKIKMASGGVVTGPTQALIGEGIYDEAVIPLGNSPQMEDLITKIADAVTQNSNNSGAQQPIEVKVMIGDKEWDAFTYKSAQRGQSLVGAQPIQETRR